MAKSFQTQIETSIQPYKSKEYYPKKAKGMSLLAFLLSLFIYISIFYVFNLSPSSLFHTSKFWFFISNTLILIIAADYSIFSASKQKENSVHQEYYARSIQTRNGFDYDWGEKKENPNGILLIMKNPEKPIKEKVIACLPEKCEKVIECLPEKCDIRPRNSSEGLPEMEIQEKVEDNEFSKMSDEELNQRVEEFIQKFNRQIRLQTRYKKFSQY